MGIFLSGVPRAPASLGAGSPECVTDRRMASPCPLLSALEWDRGRQVMSMRRGSRRARGKTGCARGTARFQRGRLRRPLQGRSQESVHRDGYVHGHRFRFSKFTLQAEGDMIVSQTGQGCLRLLPALQPDSSVQSFLPLMVESPAPAVPSRGRPGRWSQPRGVSRDGPGPGMKEARCPHPCDGPLRSASSGTQRSPYGITYGPGHRRRSCWESSGPPWAGRSGSTQVRGRRVGHRQQEGGRFGGRTKHSLTAGLKPRLGVR